jgi:hypothetical protein
MKCLLGWLLFIGTSVQAACPPAGHTTASLQAMKASGWQHAGVHAKAPVQDLALALVDCLADADPALRDGIAFEALQAWSRGGQLDIQTLQTLRMRLSAQLAAAPDADGFRQPFAALVLAEVARVDRLQPYLTDEERAALITSAADYLAGVRDLRGFEPVAGWRHGVAHGADLVLQLSLNPALSRAQADALLAAIAQQVLPVGTHFWRFGEPERLAAPVFYLAGRSLLTAEEWQRWFEGLLARYAGLAKGDVRTTVEGLAARHNLVNFLTGLYTTVQESKAPEPRTMLLPALRAALRAVD